MPDDFSWLSKEIADELKEQIKRYYWMYGKNQPWDYRPVIVLPKAIARYRKKK